MTSKEAKERLLRNPDLQIHEIPTHSPEWFEFRKSGIGGSEVGTLLGLNLYETRMRTFHEKVGTADPKMFDNSAMFFGRELEDKIREVWQYHDGTADGFIENKKSDTIIRTCTEVGGYVTNKKYPWLFASPDGLINPGGANLLTGEILDDFAILEIKTLSYFGARAWENGIPAYYYTQVHLYMLLLETDYAEIAILRDGNKFEVQSMYRDERLMDRIIKETKTFWYDQVLPAKEAKQKRDQAFTQKKMNEYEHQQSIIDSLEPEPDNSEAYKDFISERFAAENEASQGGLQQYRWGRDYNFLLAMERTCKELKQGIQNKFLNALKRQSVEELTFGKGGNVRFYTKKNAKKPTIDIRILPKYSDDDAYDQVIQLLDGTDWRAKSWK